MSAMKGKAEQLSFKWRREFRREVLAVQFVCSMVKLYKDYAALQAEKMSFAELTTSALATKKEDLFFDVSWFKAEKERDISSEVKDILSRPPRDRKPDEIKLATLALRDSVDTFADYPQALQENLAKVGWYESFGPGRVIIRQGHVPQNFYLILTGLVMVSKKFVDKKTGELRDKTAAFLKKGWSFGEVAILNGARRNATVVCHSTVSLLAVSRQDFKHIFMSKEGSNGPEFMEFLQKIDVLSGWPLEKLPTNNGGVCLHAFFRGNRVISRDTRLSSYIFIVKSGTVQVIKKLISRRSCPSMKHSKNRARAGNLTCVELQGGSREVASLLPMSQRGTPDTGYRGTTDTPTETNPTPILTPISRAQDWTRSQKLYINLQTLKAGDVFGLAYLLYEDTFSMALVSEGAECILIAKDFMKKHADDAYLSTLAKLVRPYPSEHALQKQLQEFFDWKAYKRTVIEKLHK